MDGKRVLWTELLGEYMKEVEEETMRSLPPPQRGFFVRVSNDWLDIAASVNRTYPVPSGPVLWVTIRLMHELVRLQFFYVTGNYDILLGRLRFIWEAISRAYLSETHVATGPKSLPSAGGSLDEQVEWLDRVGTMLDWNRCIEPVLRRIHPDAETDAEVRRRYQDKWRTLHRHVHPAEYLTTDMLNGVDDTKLFGFDRDRAENCYRLAVDVFDVVWLYVCSRYPLAFEDALKLTGSYPTLSRVCQTARTPESSRI